MCLKIKETPFLQGVPLVTIVIYIVIPYESFSIKISECFKTLERCKIRTPDGQVNGYSGVRIKSLI